jgi:arylsulfatase A-like enzyme
MSERPLFGFVEDRAWSDCPDLSPFEGGFRVPGIMCAPGEIPAGARYGEMMSHIDLWATLATMVGLTPPPHGAWVEDHRLGRLGGQSDRATRRT